MVVESFEGPDGEWFRRAAYPELGVVAEALSPLDAIGQLEQARVKTILGRLERGEPVPVPRPPLRDEIGGLDPERGAQEIQVGSHATSFGPRDTRLRRTAQAVVHTAALDGCIRFRGNPRTQ